jgi:hypothetical protein
MSTENASQDPLADVLEDAFFVGRFNEDPVDRDMDWQRAAWCARQFMASEKSSPSVDAPAYAWCWCGRLLQGLTLVCPKHGIFYREECREPAPSVDAASVEELAKVMSDYALELHAAGRDWEWDDMAAAAIAHCGQREAEQRQRAEKAEADLSECRDAKGGWAVIAVDMERERNNLRAEVERLKAEVEAWKDVAAACTASQPAPEGLSKVGDTCSFCDSPKEAKRFVLANERASVCNECLGALVMASAKAIYGDETEDRRVTQPQALGEEPK